MFLGTIPGPMRSIVREVAKSWPTGDLYVPACGNFTIERSVADLGFRIHSSDVSIYTSAIGRWLTGQPVGIRLREESEEELGWLRPYLDDGIGTVATLMLGTRFLQAVGKQSLWWERTLRGYRTAFKRLHAETVEKIRGITLPVASYDAEDIRSWLERIPADGPVATFPPFYCLAPGERILTADLRWVPAGELVEGDALLGFDEHPPEGHRMRKWRPSVVTRSEPAVKDCVRVRLANGDSVVCSTDHPWLSTKYPHANGGVYAWVEASALEGRYVLRTLDPWEGPADTYDTGWLAGMFDGEGSVHIGYSSKLAVSQLPGPVADRFQQLCDKHGIGLTVTPRPNEVLGMGVTDGFPELLRVLGTLRPERLITNLQAAIAKNPPSVRRWGNGRVLVERVEHIGPHPVQSIATSTRTYVGEGYLHHNSNGYEKIYGPLDAHLTWDAPEYEPLADDDVVGVLRLISGRPNWLTASNHHVPDLEPYLRGVIKATNRSAPFYVYAASARSRIVQPRQVLEPVTMPRLQPGELIGDRLALAYLSMGQFNALRSQYLNHRIRPGAAGSAALAVVCGGRLIGVAAFSPPSFNPTEAYLLSDFAVAPTDYKKLSKLVLLAATSVEAQRLVQRSLSRRITHIQSTAFTNKPVSMKYRGLFELTKRGKSTDPAFTWMLNYRSPMGEHTLAEGLDLWKRRYGQRTEPRR